MYWDGFLMLLLSLLPAYIYPATFWRYRHINTLSALINVFLGFVLSYLSLKGRKKCIIAVI